MTLINTAKLILRHPVNQDCRPQAIKRYVTWQIGSRFLKKPVVWDWINGAKFLVKTGEVGLTGNIYNGLHEFEDMSFVLHALKPEDLFVDVGANAGSYTILACASIGANVIAFEPSSETFKRLESNAKINNLGKKLRLVKSALGSKKGVVKFSKSLDSQNCVLSQDVKESESVNVTTLDVFLNGECPFIIKVDVEGYEMEVLEGAKNTLSNPNLNAVIVEINGNLSNYGFKENDILKKMNSYGFKPYSYSPKDRLLTQLNGRNLKCVNTIFIRDEKTVNTRIKESKGFSIYNKKY